MLAISIVTDSDSWYRPHALALAVDLRGLGHTVEVVDSPSAIPEGDVAFFLSLGKLVTAAQRRRNTHNIVVHASALPRGKGWSPVTWQVIEGQREIPFTLFEAEDAVDSGRVYLTGTMHTNGTELVHELRELQAETTNDLCLRFIRDLATLVAAATEQDPTHESFYARRGPSDSEIDPHLSLAAQFDLIRTCDPERYPAFFDFRGRRYELVLRAAPAADG